MNQKLMKLGRQTQALVLLLAVSACTSLQKQDTDKADLGVKANDPKDVIVNQPNQLRPVISKYERRHWVNVRKKIKFGQKHLYATLATGEWAAAEKEARKYLMSHPKDKVGLTVLALAVAMQKNFSLGGYYARLYEKFHGESPDSLNLKALALVAGNNGRMRDYRSAEDLFRQAFDQNPSEIASGMNLGHLYLEIGDAPKARAVFAEVKNRCESCIHALIGEGIAQIRLRKFRKARANFERILDQNEYHPQALFRLAQIAYYGEKDFDKAKRYIDTLLVRTDEKQFVIRQKALALVRDLDSRSEEEYIAQRQKEQRKSRKQR